MKRSLLITCDISNQEGLKNYHCTCQIFVLSLFKWLNGLLSKIKTMSAASVSYLSQNLFHLSCSAKPVTLWSTTFYLNIKRPSTRTVHRLGLYLLLSGFPKANFHFVRNFVEAIVPAVRTKLVRNVRFLADINRYLWLNTCHILETCLL